MQREYSRSSNFYSYLYNKQQIPDPMIDYFASNLWQLWLLVCLVCLVLELSSGDFFIMCFSIGAFFTTLAAAMDMSFTGQVVCFAICSALCIFFVRPVALRYLHGHKQRVSNADAIIGRIGVVSQDIEAGGFGRVAIDGDDWKAQADNSDVTIAKGDKVKVLSRDSIIITVAKA